MSNSTENASGGTFPDLPAKRLVQGEHLNPLSRALRGIATPIGDRRPDEGPPRVVRGRVSEIGDRIGLYKFQLYSGELPALVAGETTVNLGSVDEPAVQWLVNRPDVEADAHQLAVGAEVSAVIVGYDKATQRDIFDVLGVGAALPRGEFQGMHLQMVSQNQLGFDWTMAHGLLGGDEYE